MVKHPAAPQDFMPGACFDDVEADAGSGGAVFATDDDSSRHWPYIKVAFGANNTQNIVGTTTSNPLPVAFVPGTGATDLGKAIDTAVGATDTGVAILAKHQAAGARLSTAELDYDIARLSEFGALLTEPEQHLVIDTMDALLGGGGTWAAINNDTTGVASSTKHVLGTASVEFDKVNGAADSQIGGITKALTSIDLSGASPHDILQCVVQVGATTELDDGASYFFLRLGTNSTDYNEWRIPGTEFTAGIWETIALEIGDASFAGQGGDGITWTAITYIAVGFFFDDVDDTLANIYVDEISFHTNQHVNAAINAEITSSVSSANINLAKVAGSPATKSSGNVGQGTQRVTIATDDVNQAAIKVATELIDDAIYVDDGDWTALSSKHALIGGVYTSAERTITDGDTGPLSLDVNGHVITSAHAEAIALGDDVSNTANIKVDESGAFAVEATFGYNFDGSTWDRVRGDSTDGLLVNLGANNDISGTVTANAGTNLNTSALLTTAAHDAALGTAGTADAQVRSVQGIASMTPLLVDATGQGDVPITLAGEAVVLGAGTAGIGKLTANTGVDIGDVDVTSLPGAIGTGGSAVHYTADLNAKVEVTDTAASTVYWIHVMNITAALAYVQIWDLDADDVTHGSTAVTYEFAIPTQGDTNGAGFTLNFGPHGIAHATGLTIAASTAAGGSSDPNGVSVVLGYSV